VLQERPRVGIMTAPAIATPAEGVLLEVRAGAAEREDAFALARGGAGESAWVQGVVRAD
jgi:hypothetical protein